MGDVIEIDHAADVLLGDAESDRYRHLPFRSPASLEVFEYGRELARGRRGGDGEGRVSKLVNRTPIDGEPLTATEFDSGGWERDHPAHHQPRHARRWRATPTSSRAPARPFAVTSGSFGVGPLVRRETVSLLLPGSARDRYEGAK